MGIADFQELWGWQHHDKIKSRTAHYLNTKIIYLCDNCRFGKPISMENHYRLVEAENNQCIHCLYAVFSKRVDKNWVPEDGLERKWKKKLRNI